MQRDRLPYLLIPLAAFIAIQPLILNGCSCGHDFDFHLLSWMEAARQFTHGNLHPHWAYTPAYNAGEPRFVFYPPLSWTIGAILTLIFPIGATPILYTWLALTASGLALYYLARDFAPPTPVLLAAILYTVNPYMLFTAYERTAYAELLAAAFIPLLLHAILRQRVTIPRIAIPVALLWLTNAPAAVMSCYALALLTAIRLLTRPPEATTNPGAPSFDSETGTSPGGPSFAPLRRVGYSRHARTAVANSPSILKSATQTPLQLAINTIAGTTLGLGLAAFYILPAAYERRYVQIAMAIIPNMRIQDNFLFHHTGDAPHDQVLHTASLIAIILIALTAAAIAITYLRRPAKHPAIWAAQTNLSDTREQPPAREKLAKKQEPAANNKQREVENNQYESSKETSSRPKRSEVERPPYFAEPAITSDHSHNNSPLPSLIALTTAITLLLTPLTAIIWNHAPELVFLQFPWRLVAILTAALALSIALALKPISWKPITRTAVAIALSAALTFPAYSVFHQSCDEEDTPRAREALFHSNQGTDPTDEYTPTTADNDSLAQNDPAFWLSPDPNAKAPNAKAPNAKARGDKPTDANSINTQTGPAPPHFTITTSIPEDLILNLRDYPAWRITRNGIPTTHNKQDQRDDGLIAIPIPAGPSTIDITYAHTLDQTIADATSLVSLALLFFIALRRKASQ
ncbi:hypothetical protein [Tunturiibacter lichenicola]|uniref:hypothetical protein n=1 Tax=Tunturiibacter lichenicola TaxID=2051959 RepID=UPI003D9B7183